MIAARPDGLGVCRVEAGDGTDKISMVCDDDDDDDDDDNNFDKNVSGMLSDVMYPTVAVIICLVIA